MNKMEMLIDSIRILQSMKLSTLKATRQRILDTHDNGDLATAAVRYIESIIREKETV